MQNQSAGDDVVFQFGVVGEILLLLQFFFMIKYTVLTAGIFHCVCVGVYVCVSVCMYVFFCVYICVCVYVC